MDIILLLRGGAERLSFGILERSGMNESHEKKTGEVLEILETVLALGAKCAEIGVKALSWAAILFVTLVSAMLSGGKK